MDSSRPIDGEESGLPEDWNTERDDAFRDVATGLVESYDGTVYRDPEMHVLRFESRVQLIRYIHYETGRPIDELWDEYEVATTDD